MSKSYIFVLIVGILWLSLSGCGSISDYEPLGSGYIYATYTQNSITEPSGHQFALFYSPGERKFWVKVWPSAGGIVIKNDVALFIGDKATKKPTFGESWDMEERLFAVKSPELPLDITDEVLWRWSKQSGTNYTKFTDHVSASYTNDVWVLSFCNFKPRDTQEIRISMDSNQMLQVMRKVQEQGVERKDLRWGTKYIEDENRSPIQK